MNIVEKLSSFVGAKNVLAEESDLVSYSTDASQINGKTIAIVLPRFNEDVRKVVRFASRNGLNIVPRGAGTGLAGGAVPQNSIIMDFSRMRRIMVLNKKEKTIVVEPGVVLAELNEKLEQYGLFFPIVPNSQKVCTLGGMIATNAAGYRAIKYGKVADWIEQLEVVDGTGKLFVFRKNNDFVGSEGTLGIITKAKLCLIELPTLQSMSLDTYKTVHDMMADVINDLDRPNLLGIEYFDSVTAQKLGLEEKNHLIVEYEDDQGEIKDPDEMLRIIEMREGIAPVLASKGYGVFEDPKLELEKIDKFLLWLHKKKIPNFGHIGLGIVHPQFKKGQDKLIKEMFEQVKKLGGEVSGEHGIGITKKKYAEKAYVEKIKTLKKKYDPERVLNVKKIV